MRRRPSETLVEHDLGVPALDGVDLATDVYRPHDDVARPCLVQRVPYSKDVPVILNGALDVARAVDAGYAVVVQDCRGRFRSDGRFEPFTDEADDGVATVAWAAAQPWCDGNVGLFGRSYSGLNQWLVAERRPPALRAIAPMLSGAEPWRDWILPNGVVEWGFVLLWCVRNLAPDLVARGGSGAAGAGVDAAWLLAQIERIDALYRDLDGDDATRRRLAAVVPFLEACLDVATGAAPPPTSTSTSGGPSSAGPPALVIAGWFDLFLTGCLRTFEQLAAEPGRAGLDRLVVGPWPHGGANPGVFPERNFGLRASGDAVGLTRLQLEWFDRWLRRDGGAPAADRPDGDGPVATTFVLGRDEWRTEPSWPPPGTSSLDLFLGRGSGEPVLGVDGYLGALAATPPGDDGHSVLAFDEDDPVPTLGGPTFLPGLEVAANAGPRDQRRLVGRPDVAVFVGEPLAAGLDVCGHVTAVLHVADPRPGLRCWLRLLDVDPDGRLLLLTEGGGPLPDDVAVGRPCEVRLEVGATSAWFAPGHRVGLLVAHTSFPRYRRRAYRHDGPPEAGSSTLLHGPATPSRLSLPVRHAT